MLSAIEKQRQAKAQKTEESNFAAQDMSGEMQTIPARHGVATFVPKGRTIKIINTYGKQVVSTWAIGLGAPPEEEENEEEECVKMEERVDELKEEMKQGDDAKSGDDAGAVKEETAEKVGENESENKATIKDGEDKSRDTQQAAAKDTEPADQAEKDKPEEDKPDEEKHEADKHEGEKHEGDKHEGDKHEGDKHEEAEDPPEQAPESSSDVKSTAKNTKRTWSSYIPSIPYRSKASNKASNDSDAPANQENNAKKAQGEADSKKWSSYLPTGKGFSSYVPNIQMPDTKGVVSAFKSSNSWDPNNSYAEQLYDFSKTPVGAGTLAGMYSRCTPSTSEQIR